MEAHTHEKLRHAHEKLRDTAPFQVSSHGPHTSIGSFPEKSPDKANPQSKVEAESRYEKTFEAESRYEKQSNHEPV